MAFIMSARLLRPDSSRHTQTLFSSPLPRCCFRTAPASHLTWIIQAEKVPCLVLPALSVRGLHRAGDDSQSSGKESCGEAAAVLLLPPRLLLPDESETLWRQQKTQLSSFFPTLHLLA